VTILIHIGQFRVPPYMKPQIWTRGRVYALYLVIFMKFYTTETLVHKQF